MIGVEVDPQNKVLQYYFNGSKKGNEIKFSNLSSFWCDAVSRVHFAISIHNMKDISLLVRVRSVK